MRIELYGENLESQFIKIRRVPRGGAIVQDILLSTITFGLPIIIDPFRADFYKIAKGSRQFDIKMKYTQQFMLDEYKKIENSNIALNFENYIVSYDYSDVKQLAVNKRDSLELFTAIQKSDEKKIDEFIKNRPESVFMSKATEVKNILKSSRVDFENSKKIDKAITYKKFVDKYPQSLQTNEAKKLMVNAAEKECLAANKLDSTIFYLDNYLLPNEQIVVNDFSAKIRMANNLIEKQIIDELYLNKSDKYEASKEMCKYYTNFKNKYKKYSDLTSLLEIDFLRGDIAIILFNKLKSASDQSTQSSFLDEAQKTFIDIYEENNWKKNLPISYHILIEARGKNGSIKLYNQQYVKNHLEHLGEAGSEFTDIHNYTYKGQKYKALENVDYEEFEIKEDVYVKVKLYYKGSLVVESDNRFKSDFYKNGQLVKTKFHKWDNNGNRIGYEYEFENGVNLSLKELTQKLDEAEKLTAQKDYQAAVTKFESCRNSFPQDIPENIRFKKSFDRAFALLEEYNKKQEEIRLAEERKKEQARLAEEKRLEQIRLAEEQKRLLQYLTPQNIAGVYKYDDPPFHFYQLWDENLNIYSGTSSDVNKLRRSQYSGKFSIVNGKIVQKNSQGTNYYRLNSNYNLVNEVDNKILVKISNIGTRNEDNYNKSQNNQIYKFDGEGSVAPYLLGKTFERNDGSKILINMGDVYINGSLKGYNVSHRVLSGTKAYVFFELIESGHEARFLINTEKNSLTDTRANLGEFHLKN
jgi:hypothetical protein